MLFSLRFIHDVQHRVPLSFQIIRDEASMTSPPNSLCTHHRHTSALGEFK